MSTDKQKKRAPALRCDRLVGRYAWAGGVARLAMGKTQRRRGSPAEYNADLDPLAWWCLTELIATGGHVPPNTTLSHAGTSARQQDGAATGVGSGNS